ncbi:MAG TPA: hypothetical protein DEG17_10100 [Cyanobacteria bacterium UBA11149]|nr:hypothetical protein [Cyanobacteria bacterium UBA11367]HBE58990.1 hypothetical protein [Cyanobacteria bacterium UBA11366]HBK63016.1 hypothetical protein [Cyanobacteria bacterium UBA11166]HBR76755.1 hypothetical protein [Cyanobacteria bacterium UBA11159]HBS70383.1 hypothetical protein [Cyanobacteria bacterium UBA11153]HBW89200.1 hypothetical protein [Cyanobacteria bacterium UBA11149]HCA97159.1 hypothetical protein [Cyanobacteria bacterium UBA9226]
MDNKLISLIIRNIFPAQSTIVENGVEVQPEKQFWIISSQKYLRWIVPRNPNYGLLILTKWQPYNLSSRIKWQILMTAYRLGKLDKLPGIIPIVISDTAPNNWEHLGYKKSENLTPIIYIGTPGLTRKAVVFLVNMDTRELVGIGKIPLESLGINQIIHEAETLLRLASEKPGFAPNLLFMDRERGISVQSAIAGAPTGRKLTKAHIEWLSCLVIPGGETSLSKQVATLKERLAQTRGIEEEMRSRLNQLWEIIDDSTPLPSTWVHGDFAPWNLKWVAGKKISAVDWEEARCNGLPLEDLCHYLYIQSYLFHTHTDILDEMANNPLILDYLKSLGITADIAAKLVGFYLAQTWIKSIEKGDLAYAAFLNTQIFKILSLLSGNQKSTI